LSGLTLIQIIIKVFDKDEGLSRLFRANRISEVGEDIIITNTGIRIATPIVGTTTSLLTRAIAARRRTKRTCSILINTTTRSTIIGSESVESGGNINITGVATLTRRIVKRDGRKNTRRVLSPGHPFFFEW